MVQLWNERGLFAVSEQRLVDQVRQIKLKGWVTAVEIDEMREQRRRTATQSDVPQENVENNVNEIIRQENTSSDNQAIGENRNKTAEAAEHVSSFGENEYTDEELEIAERLSKVPENAEKVEVTIITDCLIKAYLKGRFRR